MKRLFIFFIVTLFVLNGCGVPRPEPAPPPRAEPPPRRVEAVAPPVLAGGTEFEQARRRLIERGILKENTPVYRVDEVVKTDRFRYTLDHFFWGKDKIIVNLRFFGRENDEGLFRHRVRLIVDNREHLTSLLVRREMEDGYVMSYRFAHAGIPEPPEPEVYNYVVVFVRLGISPEENAQHRMGPRRPEALAGDVAFVLEREDMVIRR